MKKPHIGAILITAAFLFASINSAFVKILIQSGMSMFGAIFYQIVIAFFLMIPLIIKSGLKNLIPGCPKYYVLRVVAGTLSGLFFFWSLSRTSLAKAVLLNNSAPLFIPLFIWILFSKKPSLKTMLSVSIGFMGVLFIIRPDPTAIELGDAAALISGVFAALALIGIRLIQRTGTEKDFTVILYFTISLLIASGLMFLKDFQFPNNGQWGYIVFGGLAYMCFQFLVTAAFSFAGANTISPFMYSGVIFAGIIDWKVWGKAPTFFTMIGILLVMMGGIFAMKLATQIIPENKK